ncbi:hypothetical protein [Apilactobacillus kunkeei]|uniref:hypothetical protein n=1 Tax=Apilactobacillus kunkeei TaxID=148814 RepID=UPI0006B245CD|nr:hypothetical protein [Apilactobacillus kunkeei]KOY70561.1 hypothetical protein RZ73_00340 [Apilactobacillus kunkeei]CAI2605350.1 hypothetical protein AKUFHON2_00390 [Apilactobacillus kunkeei]
MKIKKSFFAIMAVLTLFAASASTSISSFTSVEANAATHHKNEKKHKKAKKSSKKHKKTTKKSKKKATKKHSKKKVAKKKKKATKKHVAKTPAGPTPITYSNPTITINPDDSNPIKVEYTNKQYKSYNDQVIKDDSTDEYTPNKLILKGITYYNLTNSQYHTAMTLTLLVQNPSVASHDYFSSNNDYTYISSNNVDKKLYPAWGDYAMNVPANSQQVIDLTFVGNDNSTSADFSSFSFNYTPDYSDTIAVNLNL